MEYFTGKMKNHIVSMIITKFLQHFVAVAICVLKLEINILKHLAIHGMTTASRVLRVMWTFETAVFTIETVCLFAKPTLDEPTFTPICFTILSAYAPNDESGDA